MNSNRNNTFSNKTRGKVTVKIILLMRLEKLGGVIEDVIPLLRRV